MMDAPYRDPAPAPPPDAELALVAEYFVYGRRVKTIAVLLYLGGVFVTFPFLYLTLAERLAERQHVSWPYAVAVTAAVLTLAVLFAIARTIEATVILPLRRRWIRAAAARHDVDPRAVEELLF
jgi:NADH:ubiquinone oxidoreductase subunit 6 (subunit J)